MCNQRAYKRNLRDEPVSENESFDNNDNIAAFTREYVQTDTLAVICQ